ncbi:unnamed protein product [Urochloa humidicola]
MAQFLPASPDSDLLIVSSMEKRATSSSSSPLPSSAPIVVLAFQFNEAYGPGCHSFKSAVEFQYNELFMQEVARELSYKMHMKASLSAVLSLSRV